jgi:hypothetical protein
MKAYLAQLPPLAWVGLLLPVLAALHLILVALTPFLIRSAVPASVCNFLRLL